MLNDQIHLFYQTYGNWEKDAICHAWSQDGIHFTKNPENPVFHPAATWCCGRAIDADVCVFGGKIHLYFATRDHAMRIQKIGGAWAKIDSAFGRNAWHPLAEQSLLMPELAWEGDCVEAPATVVEDGQYTCSTAAPIIARHSKSAVQYPRMASSSAAYRMSR